MLIEWISHPESTTRSDPKLENFLPWESNSLTNSLDPGIFSRFSIRTRYELDRLLLKAMKNRSIDRILLVERPYTLK